MNRAKSHFIIFSRVFLTLVMMTTQLQAQDLSLQGSVAGLSERTELATSHESVVNEDFKLASIESNSPQMSVVESTEMILSSSAQTAGMTAGICLVVSGVLADFCKAYPGDISCNF